jgi:hypothetical protein
MICLVSYIKDKLISYNMKTKYKMTSRSSTICKAIEPEPICNRYQAFRWTYGADGGTEPKPICT